MLGTIFGLQQDSAEMGMKMGAVLFGVIYIYDMLKD